MLYQRTCLNAAWLFSSAHLELVFVRVQGNATRRTLCYCARQWASNATQGALSCTETQRATQPLESRLLAQKRAQNAFSRSTCAYILPWCLLFNCFRFLNMLNTVAKLSCNFPCSHTERCWLLFDTVLTTLPHSQVQPRRLLMNCVLPSQIS